MRVIVWPVPNGQIHARRWLNGQFSRHVIGEDMRLKFDVQLRNTVSALGVCPGSQSGGLHVSHSSHCDSGMFAIGLTRVQPNVTTAAKAGAEA